MKINCKLIRECEGKYTDCPCEYNEYEKFYCWNNGCNNEIPEPIGCCSGVDCGCMGLPTEPPFCSHECMVEYRNNLK